MPDFYAAERQAEDAGAPDALGTDVLGQDTHAVALTYRPTSDEAPKVVAKGKGTIAAQILAVAEANGVPIRKDADLAALLAHVDLDTEIPVEAFVATAEILTHLYRLNGLPRELQSDVHTDRAREGATR